MCGGYVTRSTRANRNGWPCAARAAVDQAVPHNRCRNYLNLVTAAIPKYVTRLGIEGIDTAAAADNDLDTITYLHGYRCSPSRTRTPAHAPELPACLFIDCDDEPGIAGIAPAHQPLLLQQDQPVLVQQRRSSRAVVELNLTKADLPEHLAVEINRQQATISEVGINTPPVG